MANESSRRPGHRWILRVGDGFDGLGPLGVPTDVVIEGERIAAVVPTGASDQRPAIPVVDLGSGFAHPGLINAHEHLIVTHHLTEVDQGIRTTVFGPHWRNLLVAGYQMDFGVTTIHGLAGPLFGELALRDRLLPGYGNRVPDYLTVGPITTSANGYPPYVDGRSGRLLLIKAESVDADEARRWVHYLAQRGVDAIKVATGDYGYGGSPLPDWMRDRPEVLHASVDEAHRLGLRVFAHTYSAAGFALALSAGADVLAHLPVDHLDDSVLDEVVDRGAIVIPTLFHMHCRVNARFPGDLERNGADFDPDRWHEEFALMENDTTWGERLWTELHRFDRPLGSSNPAYDDRPLDFERVAAATATMRDALHRLHERGAALGYGQDSSHSIPYRELREMARCGLSTTDVLHAATVGSARAIGRGDDRGRLAVGMRADIVVQERSPLADLSALRRLPLAVIRNGEIVRCSTAGDPGSPGPSAPSRFALRSTERRRFVASYLTALAGGSIRGLGAPHRRALTARTERHPVPMSPGR